MYFAFVLATAGAFATLAAAAVTVVLIVKRLSNLKRTGAKPKSTQHADKKPVPRPGMEHEAHQDLDKMEQGLHKELDKKDQQIHEELDPNKQGTKKGLDEEEQSSHWGVRGKEKGGQTP